MNKFTKYIFPFLQIKMYASEIGNFHSYFLRIKFCLAYDIVSLGYFFPRRHEGMQFFLVQTLVGPIYILIKYVSLHAQKTADNIFRISIIRYFIRRILISH
jgi:hypothetical protein